MTQRFQVIEGGLSQREVGGVQAIWQVPEAAEASSFVDPGYLMPSDHQRTYGHNLAFALAWSRGEETETGSLHDLASPAPRQIVRERGRVRYRRAPSEGLPEAHRANDAAAALRRRLVASLGNPSVDAAGRAALKAEAHRALGQIPADTIIGVGAAYLG